MGLGGLELRTPILDIRPGWRDHVIAAWDYLEKFYTIRSDRSCATHVHISLEPSYTLDQLKRIASSIIHFETALEAVMPPARRNNGWARSNWLSSPRLAAKNKSRKESIREIESVISRPSVIRLMQELGNPCFAWNLWSLNDKSTIEFRKPPGSVTAAEALTWAELALNFIQAAIRFGDSDRLSNFPSNVGGLRNFLGQFNEPGVNEPERLRRLWDSVAPDAAIEPTY